MIWVLLPANQENVIYINNQFKRLDKFTYSIMTLSLKGTVCGCDYKFGDCDHNEGLCAGKLGQPCL